MADLLNPPRWTDSRPPEGPRPGATERVVTSPTGWPLPPVGTWPPARPQTVPLPCAVTGFNDREMRGVLIAFVPDQGVALLQLPPSRSKLPLRFDQFRSLSLGGALPIPPGSVEGTPAWPAPTAFHLTWKQGTTWRGLTHGHVETPFGLFLFTPAVEPATGALTRVFVPKTAIGQIEFASPIPPAAGPSLAPSVGPSPKRGSGPDAMPISLNIATPDQLIVALAQQARMPIVRIGEALLSMGLLSEAELLAALNTQRNDPSVPIGEVLVRSGLVSRPDLQVAMARKMGYPLVDVDAFPVEAEALRKLPYAAAVRLRVLPLMVREGRLIVALDDPARRHTAVEEVEFAAEQKVLPVLALSRSMDQRTHQVYEQIGATTLVRPGDDSPESAPMDLIGTDQLVETLEREEDSVFHDDRPIEQSDNSLVRLINNMIIEAHRDGVSDIHVESYPGREKIRIRFRKDGLLRTYLELPPNYRSSLIARIKIMCDLDISERRKPQDGKINFARFSPQHRLELRVATVPTNNGLEDVVMRLLVSARPIPLHELGLSARNLKSFKTAIERPHGLVLCVGPTGSGKTTTLHSALAAINQPQRKIWTAEDPIEITQPGLRQVQVNPRIDWTFAKALRAFLRADPDVVMVGEIRDRETAQMAIEASLTGHLVLSTLHTNSAAETVTRLLDMGMDPFNFADSLLAVLAQRLVRRLCSACRESRPATEDEIDEWLDDYLHAFESDGAQAPDRAALRAEWTEHHGVDGRLMKHHSPGCTKCDHTGYRGRAGLHELMGVSRDLRRLVQTGERASVLQQLAMREGLRTLRQDGIEKVLAGITTIEDVRAISEA